MIDVLRVERAKDTSHTMDQTGNQLHQQSSQIHYIPKRYIHARIQRGAGGPDPLTNHKYLVNKQYWSGSPDRLQRYQASIQSWAIIGPPAKRHFEWRFAGGPNMARFLCYLDPLSPQLNKKKKRCQSVWIRTCY